MEQEDYWFLLKRQTRSKKMKFKYGDKVMVEDDFYGEKLGTVVGGEKFGVTGLLGYNLGTFYKFDVKINENEPNEKIIIIHEDNLFKIKTN